MASLIVLRGLPGCGKSTHAEAYVAEDPATRFRVNQDALRGMAHAGVYLGNDTDRQIRAVRNASIRALLDQAVTVVSDDTNLKDRDVAMLLLIAQYTGARFVVIDLSDVPLDVCLQRNALRTGPAHVPEARIREMHAAHIAGRGYPIPLPRRDAMDAALADAIASGLVAAEVS